MKYHYTVTTKNMQDLDATKSRTEKKLNKLQKLLPENADIYVTYSVIKQDNKVEVSIPLPKRILRAQVTSHNMQSAIDDIVDVLEKQMIKYKSRLRDRSRRDASYGEELNLVGGETVHEEALDSKVIIQKTKHFPLKPMDAEEAVMEMELLGHNFYVFRNWQTDEVNVVYKRHDGTCGLIEPE